MDCKDDDSAEDAIRDWLSKTGLADQNVYFFHDDPSQWAQEDGPFDLATGSIQDTYARDGRIRILTGAPNSNRKKNLALAANSIHLVARSTFHTFHGGRIYPDKLLEGKLQRWLSTKRPSPPKRGQPNVLGFGNKNKESKRSKSKARKHATGDPDYVDGDPDLPSDDAVDHNESDSGHDNDSGHDDDSGRGGDPAEGTRKKQFARKNCQVGQ